MLFRSPLIWVDFLLIVLGFGFWALCDSVTRCLLCDLCDDLRFIKAPMVDIKVMGFKG